MTLRDFINEEIEEIRWNVQGKVVYLKRTESSNKPDIEFEYDAMGNRIAKHVKPKNSATHSTYYVRDAQGNLMATYSNSTETITLEEQPIYGSARLGTYSPTEDAGIVRGLRTYEATNHLGNVLTTYTDRIILNEDFTYTPQQTTATDYYPFGMPMPGRSFSVGNYRYGFNGQEKVNSIWGTGNASFFKFRISDNRLGRFFAIDPLFAQYPHNSTYAFSENRVIDGIELEGLEYLNSTSIYSKGISAVTGLGFGFNVGISCGTAWDMIGKTQYIAYSLVGPTNQNLEYDKDKAKFILGAEAGVDKGFQFVYDNPTFSKAMKTSGLSMSTVGLKFGLGGSVILGENIFGLKIGLEIGGTLKTGDQSTILQSISITKQESDIIPIGADWSVRNEVGQKENGKVIRFEGEVYADGKRTGIIVSTGANKIETEQKDGSIKTTYKPNGDWKSEAYSNAEKKYK